MRNGWIVIRSSVIRLSIFAWMLIAICPDSPAAVTADGCRRVVLQGEINAGQEWRKDLGDGWVFRVVPIAAAEKSYTGWDLVMDRTQGGGYPDALLVGTPPYGSLNEREIGTTYGLRAQDAVAWGPRRFHFLTSVRDLERSKELYRRVMQDAGKEKHGDGGLEAQSDLMHLVGGASSGEFQVLDAKLVAGIADPPPFAQQWAVHLERVPHTFVQANGNPTAQGELHWMRFAVTLWLPGKWKIGADLRGEPAKCAQ